MNVKEEIRQQIGSHSIVLYMKGTPDSPECGFSRRIVQILEQCGVQFTSYNVLESPELRQGIKEFSNWPTIPQLYIKGEFVGGSDIVGELHESGRLIEFFKDL